MRKFEIRVEMTDDDDNDKARNIQAKPFPVTLISKANPAARSWRTTDTPRPRVVTIRYPLPM